MLKHAREDAAISPPVDIMLRSRGFTLVEMAIVLVIVGLLLGTLLMPLTVQLEQRRISETRRSLDEIKEALLGFGAARGRLPCPATPTSASGTPGAGVENCALVAGVIPWVDLGVAETDAWGRRYRYRVTASFRDAVTAGTVAPPATCIDAPTQSSFALCSLGDTTLTDGAAAIATQVPAVIVSHGANGFGAYTPAGTLLPGAAGDEQENADGDALFISRNKTSADSPAGEFDDVMAWISVNILMNRMLVAGKLP